MNTLTIKDLPAAHAADDKEREDIRALTPEELKQIQGGRAVAVTVDGTSSGTVDDFALNTAIFEGRIKGPFVL
ncbi:MAG TPA: hypothetical protein VJ652_22150 [Noviherbaspirillum sp.]|nr:hypothetical protein [Noviherbaspirillum sp.]